jgi:hypothetical protein
MNHLSPHPSASHRPLAATVSASGGVVSNPEPPPPPARFPTDCYTLHHDGADWSLRQLPAQRLVARYQCRRTALRDSMARAHHSGARLVLIPGTAPAISFQTADLL